MKMPMKTRMRSRRYSGSMRSAGRRSIKGAGLRKENITVCMLAEARAGRQWEHRATTKMIDAKPCLDAMTPHEALPCPTHSKLQFRSAGLVCGGTVDGLHASVGGESASCDGIPRAVGP